MVWGTDLKAGYIGKQEEIASDLEKKIITVSYTEDCVLHCRADPTCNYTLATPNLVSAKQPGEAGSNNCWLIYTK